MSWAVYSDYVESCVPWFGTLPSHWTTPHLGHIVECLDAIRIPLNASERAEVPGNVPYWGANGVVGSVDRPLVDGELVLLGEDGAPFTDKTKEKAFYVNEPIWPNNHIHVLRPSAQVVPQFLTHALNATEYNWFIEGSTREKLTQGKMLSIPIAMPPIREQRSIVRFLDSETAKIDALIGKQEQLIATLREDRAATIAHAVTKGLDPHVELRDSGVEWMGTVPSHWRVRQIKWGSPVKRGASPRPIDDPKYFDDEGEWSWVRIADVSSSAGRLHETTQRLSELGSSLSVKLQPGSLFVSIAGTVGKPCITEIQACIHDGFVYFPTLDIEPEYLYRIFEAGECYKGLGKMGTQLNLNTDTIGSIHIPIPQRGEQQAILSDLDDRCEKIDALIAKSTGMIATLREYRSALITNAVTGKIDVREAV